MLFCISMNIGWLTLAKQLIGSLPTVDSIHSEMKENSLKAAYTDGQGAPDLDFNHY